MKYLLSLVVILIAISVGLKGLDWVYRYGARKTLWMLIGASIILFSAYVLAFVWLVGKGL